MHISNYLLHNKYGCWISNGIPFLSKLEALRYNTCAGSGSLEFYFHNHIWENFNRELLGKIPLTQLYKERAQQLRDTYNYLVLHYSGGSDSHNILHTFLTNNIKLDEISVRWIKPLIDGKFYKPNITDRSAKNAASEWNFSIEPTLDWIKSNKPEIKINIVDYTDGLTDNILSIKESEKSILSFNISRGGIGNYAMYVNPKTEYNLDVSNKNIGHIFGIEKPMLYVKNNEVYFQFMDSLLDSSILPKTRAEGRAELFYWTPDLPLLPFEQAFQSALFFRKNNLHEYLYDSDPISQTTMLEKFNNQSIIQKKILYSHSWNNDKFQVEKPNLLRNDWYFWIYENPEMLMLKNNWAIAMNNITSGIDKRYLIDTGESNLIRPLKTKPFHVLSFDNKY